MNTFMEAVMRLRNGRPYVSVCQNENPYRILLSEADGSHSAYYFSVPIYRKQTGKLLELRFVCSQDGAVFYGSDVIVVLRAHEILLQNTKGLCRIVLDQRMTFCSEDEIRYGNLCVYPSTNGLLFRYSCNVGESHTVNVETSLEGATVWSNDRVVALMAEQNRPLWSASCIGVEDSRGQIICPATFTYQKQSESRYSFSVTTDNPYGRYLLYEINFHEPKLCLDTTVESKHPKQNNVFGTVAFLGNSDRYGEQWLYTKFEDDLMPELWYRTISNVRLHLPKHNQSSTELSAFGVEDRFCSLGSNWTNRVRASETVCDAKMQKSFVSFDVKWAFTAPKSNYFKHFEGLLLKSKRNNSGFSVLSTGDSHAFPVILEVNYFEK